MKFEEWVSKEVDNKELMFLDLNIWNNIAKNAEGIYVQLKAAVSSLVDKNKLLCLPTSSLVLESLKIEETNRRKIIDLMDCFSHKMRDSALLLRSYNL